MKKQKYLVVFLLVFSVLLSSFSFYGYQVAFSPNFLVGKEERLLVISEGTTFKDLQNYLYDDGFVTDLVSFSLLSKLMKYHQNVKSGRFLIKADMSNLEVLRLLRESKREPVMVTFHNIRLVDELGEKITRNLLISEDEFNAALIDFVQNNTHGFNRHTIISMFIPNSYEVYNNISAKSLLERMYQEYEIFWNESRQQKADLLGMSRAEVATLASIVQAESVKLEESPKIAGLYLNRLKKGIALQADPTLVFAHRDFTLKRILNVHKEIDSPFNTYKYPGLPPGPINMPTIASIDAVLNYESHKYLYMCAKEDFSGFHNFAVTYDEHLVNARKYQRQLTIEQKKAKQKQK
jgi:UPF0755 protein